MPTNCIAKSFDVLTKCDTLELTQDFVDRVWSNYKFHISLHEEFMYVVIDNLILVEILKCPSKCVFDWKLFFDLQIVWRERGWQHFVGVRLKVNKSLILPFTNDEIFWWESFDAGLIYYSFVGRTWQQMLYMNCKFSNCAHSWFWSHLCSNHNNKSLWFNFLL